MNVGLCDYASGSLQKRLENEVKTKVGEEQPQKADAPPLVKPDGMLIYDPNAEVFRLAG